MWRRKNRRDWRHIMITTKFSDNLSASTLRARSPQFMSCKKNVDTRRDKNKNVPDPAAKPQEPKGEEKMEFPGSGIPGLPDGFVADLRISPIPRSPTRASTWPRCPSDDRTRLLIKISPIILNREHSPTPPRNFVPAKRVVSLEPSMLLAHQTASIPYTLCNAVK